MSQPLALSHLALVSESERWRAPDRDGMPGDVIGLMAQWCTTTTRSTEMRLGTAAMPVDIIPMASTADTTPTAITTLSTGMNSTRMNSTGMCAETPSTLT